MRDIRSKPVLATSPMQSAIVKLLGVALLSAAFASHALTLGRMRGAALVGQPVDIAVQVQMDPEDTPANLCVEADVFYADTRQDSARVQVSVEPTQTAQMANVRIVSSSAVDEPVVTVYLRAGCSQKTSRRYVLLADIATEPAAPLAPRAVPVPLVTVPVAPAPATASEAAPAAPASLGAGSSATVGAGAPVPRKAPATPATQRKPRPAAKPAAAAPAPARKPAVAAPAKAAASAPPAQVAEKLSAGRSAGQSRLKLDQLEILTERVATLESSVANAPTEMAAREALEAQRLQTLENSVKSLVALAAKNEASLLEMRTQLQKAESERYWNPLVLGLAALLLLALAGIVWLLLRGRATSEEGRGGNWWSGSATVPPGSVSAEAAPVYGRPSGFSPVSEPAPLSTPAPLRDNSHEQTQQQTQRVAPRSVPAPITQVDVSLVEMSESTFDRLMQSGATHSAVRKSRPGAPAQPVTAPVIKRRSINSEELFDIRQQADFFVSLGQTDQAVRILENRISESGESSPLAYLDLLKIFHSLGLKADFRQVREDFNLLFNARIPEFANFNDESKGLEAYPEVLGRITEEWGTPAVFATIEGCLYRGLGSAEMDPFDLAAFRDLLLLHAIGQWAASASDSLPGPLLSGAPGSGAVPVYAGAPPYANTVPVQHATSPDDAAAPGVDAPLPVIDGASDLDIDLTDLMLPASSEPAVPQLPPEIDDPVPMLSADNNLIDFDLTGVDSEDPQKSGKP